MVFLGQLTMLETAKLSERLAKFVMLKVVFLGAVAAPSRAEMVMWFSWCAPRPVVIHSELCRHLLLGRFAEFDYSHRWPQPQAECKNVAAGARSARRSLFP